MPEPALIPFGCDSRVRIEVEARLVANHYGLASWCVLIGEAPAPDFVLEARDALAWHLVGQRGLALEAAAKLTQCDVDTVRAGVASHMTRLARHERKVTA